MSRKHEVKVCVADRHGHKEEVLTSRRICLPEKILRFLFGDSCEILVLSPGRSVSGIEISELREEDASNE